MSKLDQSIERLLERKADLRYEQFMKDYDSFLNRYGLQELAADIKWKGMNSLINHDTRVNKIKEQFVVNAFNEFQSEIYKFKQFLGVE